MKQSNKIMSRLIVPLVIVAAIIVSSATTLLVMHFTQQKDKVPEGYISIEDMQAMLAAITLPTGTMDMEFYEITEEEGNLIKLGVDEIEQNFSGNVLSGTKVNQREWSKYASRLAKDGMTFEEAALYDRYDECCREYLENAIDGYRGGNEGNYFYYGKPVRFDDLRLTRDRAQDIYYWFKFNNPQYFFLRNGAASTNTAMYPTMYESFSNGNERARTTNELFDKLDGWIDSISDDEVTTWQKELAANDLLCRKLVYDEDEPYFQSMYSAVLLERTVCAGYSETFCAMMNAVGIDAMVALNNIHAWNVVRFDDGNYYVVDVLWNENHRDNNSPKRDYFNCGEKSSKARDTDSGEHTFGANLVSWAPELSQNDYVPTNYDISGSTEGGIELSAPDNLRVINDKDGKISLAWDAVDKATGYTIEVYNEDMTKKLLSSQLAATSVSVKYGTYAQITVRVRAEASIDGTDYSSDWSKTLSTKTNAAQASDPPASGTVNLDAPRNVRVTKNEATTTSFSWDEVKGADQYQFALFRDSSHKDIWSSGLKTKPAGSYIKLQPNTTYYYGVRAMKTVDGKDYYSNWTYFSQTTTADTAPGGEIDKPAVPANAKTVCTAENKARTTWDAVPGATGYQIYLYRDSAYQEVWLEWSKTGTELNLTSMTKGKTYYYGVRAVKTANGSEVYSDWVHFPYTHTGEIPDTLAAPANVKTVASAEDEAKTTWDAVPGATRYEIRLYRDADHQEVWLEWSKTGTELNLGPMTKDKTYYYGVRAVKAIEDAEVYSDWTYLDYTHKGLNVLAAPANVKTVATAEEKARTTWDAVPGATEYQICLFRDADHQEVWVEWSKDKTELNLKSMTKGVTYYYGVRAVKTADGVEIYSDWSYLTYKHTGEVE